MTANTDVGVAARGLGVNSATRRGASSSQAAVEPLEGAISESCSWLLERQHADGHWVGELEGDTILESEYVLLLAYLGRLDDPLCLKLCRYIRKQVNDEGGWSIYPGGPTDLSASVKAYLAMKLVGYSTDDSIMRRARALILDAGGAQACNSFTRFYLALLGLIGYDECPSVPPELVLLPHWLGFSLAAMSSWTRTILVPLTIISSFRPVRPMAAGIDELFRDDLPRHPSRRTKSPFSWTNAFLALDRVLKWADRTLPRFVRRPGVRAAHRWMLDHFENSDGLGAIFPPMIYSVVALRTLGYAADSAEVVWALRQLDDLLIEEEQTARIQPCVSPVWDTAIATIALADAGLPDYHPALLRSARWLLSKEIRTRGDWAARRRKVEPSGWSFEFLNEHYPDFDDTAMVLLALRKSMLAETPEFRAAAARALNWLLAMQNRDGGWAAFDVDIDNQVLTKVPFADHNAILDPSCPDITARALEAMGTFGYAASHPAALRALDYLWATQEPEGCWYGRWGVNYIYGTWQVLLGLRAIGHDMNDPRAARAADWLESVQQACGGWGESCASYDDPSLKGIGAPTASQTAWAVLGLIAAGRSNGEAALRGAAYLIETRDSNGVWNEDTFTGTGFPRVFYLKYHLYRVYFPLMALARFRAAGGRLRVAAPGPLACRIPALPRPFDI